jgi:3-hydroxypropanoate dehydrogenase
MPALPDAALDQVFRTARTFNHYTDEPVAEADLRAIWDLLKWGPTSANQEPLRIVWCVSQGSKDRLAEHCSGQNAPKVRAAPVTAILAMDLEFYELIRTSALRNGTLQGAYFIIAARMLGLDCGPMSGFDNAKVDEAFFAGTPYKSNFICTLGHGDPTGLRDRHPRLAFDEATRIL